MDSPILLISSILDWWCFLLDFTAFLVFFFFDKSLMDFSTCKICS